MNLPCGFGPAGMKESFLRDMKFIYPDGVDNKNQHRDLVWTYAMGWGSSLIASNQVETLRKWADEFEHIKDHNWWPDLSWEWNVPT